MSSPGDKLKPQDKACIWEPQDMVDRGQFEWRKCGDDYTSGDPLSLKLPPSKPQVAQINVELSDFMSKRLYSLREGSKDPELWLVEGQKYIIKHLRHG